MDKRITSQIWGVVLPLMAVFGSMGCLVSGFGLDSIGLGTVVSWILAAVVFSICFAYRIALYPMAGLVLLGVFLWLRGYLSGSLELLLEEMSSVYHGAYGWGIISWGEGAAENARTGTALCWLGLPIVIGTSFAVVRRSCTALAVTLAVLPLACCMIVTDTVPGVLPLAVLLLAVLLLMMSQTVRSRDEEQGNRLLAILALPVAVGVGLLFLLIPQDSYDRQDGAQKLEDTVVSWFEEGFSAPELPKLPEFTMPPITLPQGTLPQNVSGSAVNRENLELVGPKVESDMRIMTVTAERSGMLYLRGGSFDSYTGTAWTAEGTGKDSYWPGEGMLESAGEVTVSTMVAHDVLYLPYYASAGAYAGLRGGKLDNGSLKQYTFSQGTLPADYLLTATGSELESGMDAYLRLSQATQAWACAVIGDLFGTQTPELSARTVYAIADYVRSSASYSLNTPRMSGGYEDFAQWFLWESDTGYCVHFASATAVLLRAAGIPARYVTGYAVYAEAGEAVTVTGRHAHAWVEFRLPGTVWHPLESTPGDTADDSPQPTLPQPTFPEETQPEQTDPEETEPEQMFSQPPTEPERTEPTLQDTQPQPGETDAERGSGALWWWVAGIILAVTLVVLQWRIRVALRRSSHRKGRSKQRALARWQQHALMAKLLKQPVDRELLELAQKARFSQHPITAEELAAFTKVIQSQTQKLKKKPFVLQLYYTLILALY